MKNKLIFRILGALASALIIVSVFVPYISVAGNTESIWNSYQTLDSIYLPVMIIVFGVIGVVFFSLNIKTEFAYMSTGAIAFFLVMQTISFIEQDAFDALSLGYYFLALGALLTGVMAFLCNLRIKAATEPVQVMETNSQTSILDQIDRLYNDQQSTQDLVQPIQQVDTMIQPLPVQPIQSAPQEIQPLQSINPMAQSTPIVEPLSAQPILVAEPQPVEVPIVEQNSASQIPNPVVNHDNVQPVNPVVQELSQPDQSQQPVNPVVQQFTEGGATTPIPTLQPENNIQQVNPVVQELANPGLPILNNNNKTDNGLDIFGQPIS